MGTAAPGPLTTTGTRTTAAAPGPTTTAAPGLLTTLAPGLLTTAAPGLLTTLAPGLLTTAAPGLLTNQFSAPALAGQNVIQVTNQAEFAVGEIIVIDAGTPIEETRTIVGFSSIILDSTLLFDHSVTSPVQRQAVNPVTLSPGSPCDPVTTPQPAPANPCGTFARLSDGEG